MKTFRLPFPICLLVLALLSSTAVFAQDDEETLVVTSVNTRGWTTADTRTGGTVSFVLDGTSPAPGGALRLTTDSTNAAKAQFLHSTDTPIGDVVDMSYQTRQNAGPAHAAPSYQFLVCLGGLNDPVTPTNPQGCAGFTTFVYEPYQRNGSSEPVVQPNIWQSWDVDAGVMWSSQSVNLGACAVQAGAGGTYFYSLQWMKDTCPNAIAVGFGVNVGTFNPGYNVHTDLVRFNNTTYNFEVYSTPASAEDCKKGGWSTFNPEGGPFKNQGQCVASTVPVT